MAGSGSKVKIAIPIFLIFLSSILLFPFLTNSLTINEVIARTPAFHLINEIYVFLSGSYEPISSWLVFEPEALKVNKTVLKVGEKVTIMGNGSESPGLNADKVDGLEAADLLAGGGVGGMPLQGVIVLRDNANNYGISSVPIALPKENCDVKITVCDYGNNPPTKLIIGADPVPRIEKARNDCVIVVVEEVSASCTLPGGCGSGSCGPKEAYSDSGYLYVKMRGKHGSVSCGTPPYFICPFGYTLYRKDVCGEYYTSCASYISEATFCAKFLNNSVLNWVEAKAWIEWDIYGPHAKAYAKVAYCPEDYPNYDEEDNVCYAEPRCPPPSPGEVFIKEDDVDNVCVYCPSDHPIYDPTTKHCLREASVNTTKVGNCATLTTTLKFAFTDVTFADEHSDPLSTADYVTIAYVCPE